MEQCLEFSMLVYMTNTFLKFFTNVVQSVGWQHDSMRNAISSNVHRVCRLQALVHKNTLSLENISSDTEHLSFMANTGSVFRKSQQGQVMVLTPIYKATGFRHRSKTDSLLSLPVLFLSLGLTSSSVLFSHSQKN